MVIYLHGELQLLQRNEDGVFELIERRATPATESPYLLLKTTCHFPIILYGILRHALQGTISLSEIPTKIKPLQERIRTLIKDFPNDIVEVKSILALMLNYLEQMSNCKESKQLARYVSYLQELRPQFALYSAKAAELQLTGLQQISMDWLHKQQLNLAKTYIIIVGARGPKQGLIEHQYFTTLRAHYGQTEKNTLSGGLIYSEMLPQQMGTITTELLIDDLARELHNMHIGLDMLGEQHAMFKDVLGQFAAPILKSLFPVQAPQAQCPLHKYRLGNMFKFFSAASKEEKPCEKLINTTEVKPN